ncbi:MAG: CoB--CoM heterodisulfide reductase iron-sulfur subunit C [Methanosaeta sp. PtaB.Bin039]|nr:MAG: CoB--CoM heterodisulfide reductase iron-sulfur subunit C [Methanosaeta sp. PtaB.Bin039]
MAETEAIGSGHHMTNQTGREFRDLAIRLAGDEVKTCIQCGTCSSSCSTAHLMDASIRKLVQLVLEGRKEEAMACESIWLCTSCLLCTVRCPRGIRPKAVVSALRQIFEQEGRRNKDQAFERLFMDQIKSCGRISEFMLSAVYPLKNPLSTVPIMEMGIELMPKGKIAWQISCIEGISEIRRIFEEMDSQ